MKSLSMLPVWKGGDLTVGEQISPLIEVTAWQGGTGMLCRHFASGPFPSREAPACWYLSADKQEQLQQAALAVISVQDWWYCCLYTWSFCRPEVYRWSDVPSQPSLDISSQAEGLYGRCRCCIQKTSLVWLSSSSLPREPCQAVPEVWSGACWTLAEMLSLMW